MSDLELMDPVQVDADLRKKDLRIEELNEAISKINAYAEPYRDDQGGALDRIAVITRGIISMGTLALPCPMCSVDKICGCDGAYDDGCFRCTPERHKCPACGGVAASEDDLALLQYRVRPWLLECFGEKIASDHTERNHRFTEEALELVQACGATADECHQLVNYVYDRPVGEKDQEVGGVMITLAALCLANDLNMHEAGERELARIWTKLDAIRAKQAAKPDHSPLPGPTEEN